jgi:hypothetical protein
VAHYIIHKWIHLSKKVFTTQGFIYARNILAQPLYSWNMPCTKVILFWVYNWLSLSTRSTLFTPLLIDLTTSSTLMTWATLGLESCTLVALEFRANHLTSPRATLWKILRKIMSLRERYCEIKKRHQAPFGDSRLMDSKLASDVVVS